MGHWQQPTRHGQRTRLTVDHAPTHTGNANAGQHQRHTPETTSYINDTRRVLTPDASSPGLNRGAAPAPGSRVRTLCAGDSPDPRVRPDKDRREELRASLGDVVVAGERRGVVAMAAGSGGGASVRWLMTAAVEPSHDLAAAV